MVLVELIFRVNFPYCSYNIFIEWLGLSYCLHSITFFLYFNYVISISICTEYLLYVQNDPKCVDKFFWLIKWFVFYCNTFYHHINTTDSISIVLLNYFSCSTSLLPSMAFYATFERVHVSLLFSYIYLNYKWQSTCMCLLVEAE